MTHLNPLSQTYAPIYPQIKQDLNKVKKVILLQGGISLEKDVSLLSAKSCMHALQSIKKRFSFDVIPYTLTYDLQDFLNFLDNEKPDIVFNILHGSYGEDGFIQALLDMKKIPYTHSGRYTSSALMDKPTALYTCQAHHIPTPSFQVLSCSELTSFKPHNPFVIKPCNGGSSIDVYIFKNPQDFKASSFLWSHKEALVEEFIPGKELTVTVLNGEPLTVTELIPSDDHEFYDFHAKYEAQNTTHVCPAVLPQDIFNQCLDYAKKCYHIFRCRGLARIDFRFTPETNRLCFLEGNTIPGMTENSLAPEQALENGLSFEMLIENILQTATYD